MLALVVLSVLVLGHLSSIRGDVLKDFSNCKTFFYDSKVPDWGHGARDVKCLCQHYENAFRFATLYDTKHRIAVYSAYRFNNGKGQTHNYWFVEPQLVDQNWDGTMQDEGDLSYDHPGIPLGERQALDGDYKDSDYDRGHLSPKQHHSGDSRQATFTLTNVVPQNPTLNQKAWNDYENKLVKDFKIKKCAQAYMLVGAIPSDNNWIIKDEVKRVNIPDYVWNAYCCLDNNGRPILSGGATARNTDENKVNMINLSQLKEFLSQYSQVGELFSNNCGA